MNAINPRDALRGVDLFESLEPATIDALAEPAVTMTYASGGTLVEQGGMAGGLQLLLDGSADVSVGGQERRTLSPGDYFGEMSLFDAAPRSATVVAGSDGAKTLAISPVNFNAVLDTHPKSARLLLAVLARRLREVESGS